MGSRAETLLAKPSGRFAVVAARYNQVIIDRLVEGVKEGLVRNGVNQDAFDLYWVPGSFELPLVAKTLANSGKYIAVISLGCVIQGETDHYDYVCSEAASGVARASLDTGVPVIFGVLTCDTMEQALERAGGKVGNKGEEAALAAIEMANLMKSIADGK